MKIKNIAISIVCLLMCILTVACNNTPATTQTQEPNSTATPSTATQTDSTPGTGSNSTASTNISLEGTTVTITGDGAEFENGKVVITKAGEYTLSGTLDDGQIFVNATKSDKVYLILNNVDIKCSTSAAIYIACADKTTIIANSGTTNKLTDGKSYKFDSVEDEPNACIYSADDMTIKGEGVLNVVGNYKNGISSKNDITIKELTLSVDAYNTAIRGKDSIEIESGKITIESNNDGLKSTNAEEAGKGYILITGGDITIDAGDDCIQSETDVTVSGGKIKATAGGKEVNCAGTTNIAEGCIN